MPTSILAAEVHEDVVRADEPAVDLDRWRTAVEIAQALKQAGVRCSVTVVPFRRRD